MRLTVRFVVITLVLSMTAGLSADEAKALREAASAGNLEAVERELAAGVDVNGASESGGTALMYAAYGNHAEVVAHLLESGAEPDLGDRYDDPAINWAAYAGAAEAVDALLAGGADATIVTHHGDPLAIAMRRGFPEIVESVVEVTGLETGDTNLHLAARNGDLSEVERLLAAGTEADVENRIGYTPLMEASREGHLEVVSHLVSAGADPAHRGNPLGMGMTALHLAADRNQVAVARYLIDNGVAVDIGNAQGTTALLWALGEGATETANTLLEAGADPSVEDERGYAARDMADYVEDQNLRERLVETKE